MFSSDPFIVRMMFLAAAGFSLLPVARAEVPVCFKLENGAVVFRVSSSNRTAGNKVTIAPSGLGAVNERVTRAVDGSVGQAELADLDGDGTKELLLYVFTPGTGSYGDVVAYSTNGNKSLSEIHVLQPGGKALDGYGGHDEWKPVKGGLLRIFPIYRKGDPNAAPSGGHREILYRLRKGEAVWQLVPVQARDYRSRR